MGSVFSLWIILRVPGREALIAGTHVREYLQVVRSGLQKPQCIEGMSSETLADSVDAHNSGKILRAGRRQGVLCREVK
jgi:hypothetical protein